MSDLSEFLLARIAEDEAAARVAPEHWAESEGEWEWCPRARTEPLGDLPWGPEAECECNVARWTPDPRALAQCEAHRRIIELHEVKVFREWENPMDGPARQVDDHHCMVCGWVPNACDTVKALATPYADHPDYREEWKP